MRLPLVRYRGSHRQTETLFRRIETNPSGVESAAISRDHNDRFCREKSSRLLGRRRGSGQSRKSVPFHCPTRWTTIIIITTTPFLRNATFTPDSHSHAIIVQSGESREIDGDDYRWPSDLTIIVIVDPAFRLSETPIIVNSLAEGRDTFSWKNPRWQKPKGSCAERKRRSRFGTLWNPERSSLVT